MVAFSFKARFVDPIEAKTKQQTLRNVRKRNAHPGDGLQLMTGPRFRPRRFGLATCLAAGPVRIEFGGLATVAIERVWQNGRLDPVFLWTSTGLDAFAVQDGFRDWGDLEDFWRETHNPQEAWSGWWTFWGDSFTRA